LIYAPKACSVFPAFTNLGITMDIIMVVYTVLSKRAPLDRKKDMRYRRKFDFMRFLHQHGTGDDE